MKSNKNKEQASENTHNSFVAHIEKRGSPQQKLLIALQFAFGAGKYVVDNVFQWRHIESWSSFRLVY